MPYRLQFSLAALTAIAFCAGSNAIAAEKSHCPSVDSFKTIAKTKSKADPFEPAKAEGRKWVILKRLRSENLANLDEQTIEHKEQQSRLPGKSSAAIACHYMVMDENGAVVDQAKLVEADEGN